MKSTTLILSALVASCTALEPTPSNCDVTITSTAYGRQTDGCRHDCRFNGCIGQAAYYLPCGCTSATVHTITAKVCATEFPCYGCRYGYYPITRTDCPGASETK
ncbi:hypothetical protein VHEMI00080 [[Torrubiella] hemipterigena]|uniref:Uncharacterized protein n=1 Tax=[Torrubiella] hemipterigena TaxID=1531966 RepID=A0A0A1T163_9HYPO|nr:hypothetical protein VHEMI00080 [[Torrubiella] hemipterigena]